VVLKTTVEKSRPMNLAQVVIDEVTVLGSRCGPFAEAIGALARREVDVHPLISRRVKLEQLEGLFGVGKAEGFKTIVTF
jgi:threonine dehydrogenase-like Zn-dependent dehydrogenase